MNKVSRLSLVLLVGCSGGAQELLCLVGFLRGYCAGGLSWSVSVVLHDTTASASRFTRVNSPLAVFVWVELISFLKRVFLVHRLNTTLQSIYLKAIEKGLFPVATVGVARAVRIPVVALIEYMDTVALPKLAT